ncbi:hypothetical protein QNH32_13895 [Priestia flexa]|uniref:hypothetical protein n=1 Tax=Priestia flexa TaxID=86664 RepID=UPI0024BF3DD6|nr:hypothetical protein [Priestia flexa]WHX78011.1 hypothetical protein QNH32_13895 [Priestia flexa]
MLKKKFLLGLTTLSLTLGTINTLPVSASTTDAEQFIPETTIETKQELINTLKELSDSTEMEAMDDSDKMEIVESVFENTTEEAIEEYNDQIMEELQEGAEGLDQDELQETGYTSNEVTLSDGRQAEFEASDVSEDESFILQGQRLSPYSKETKNFGNRRYTATVTFTSYGVTVAKISLANHYSVGSDGLKMRYTSKSPTESYLSVFDIISATTETTDSTAPKVGHDINGLGEYTIKSGGSIFSGTKYFEIRSTIKLVKLDKAKKTASVDQRYNFLD